MNTIKELLRRGANIDEKNEHNSTSLMLASDNRHYTDVVQLLLDKGASVNEQNNFGDSALTIAAACGHEDIVQMLLEYGADVTLRNKAGFTATELAVNNHYAGLAALLGEAERHGVITKKAKAAEAAETEKKMKEAAEAEVKRRMDILKNKRPKKSLKPRDF